jgi:hypothetical protein
MNTGELGGYILYRAHLCLSVAHIIAADERR